MSDYKKRFSRILSRIIMAERRGSTPKLNTPAELQIAEWRRHYRRLQEWREELIKELKEEEEA